MKKIYVLVVVCLSFAYTSTAQTYYWIGAADGNWDDGSNWSLTSGGSAAGGYPSDDADDAIFNTSATVLLNTTIELNSLSVSGTASNVKLVGSGATDRFITVKSSSPASPALLIAAGCTLEHSAQSNTWFRLSFGDNALAQINGNWLFTGDIDDNAIASFFLGDPGFSTRVNINSGGAITIGAKGFIEPNETTGDEYLVFKGGSSLKLLGSAPVIPAANFAATSAIDITGVTDASVIFEEAGSVGTINYNSASQSNGSNHLYLSLLTFVVNGDVNILNTNNNEISLINFNATSGMASRDASIKGNLNIQGTSRVAIAHNDGFEYANNLFVDGDLVMNGTSLSLHSGNFISTLPTILSVKGNISHTAGTISASSTAVNEQTNLFIIELNGNAAQTITSHNGLFDNAQNQVALRINNASGVTLLSDLGVGRLSFNSANKGLISTGTHTLTIRNRTASSVSSLPIESASVAGYVNGTVKRISASTEPMSLPVGDASNYRPVILMPASADVTTYEANFKNSNHGGTYLAPVRGIANYYWNVNRIGTGADAAIQLNIPAQLPGALTGYEIAVTRYNGTNWISTKGTTGLVVTPGTSSSGTVRSAVLSEFGEFSISLESEGALPTYLASFDARKTEKSSAIIEWTITDNSTPDQFNIERSADGVQFNTIASLQGTASIRKYSYNDGTMLPGNNYYRLKMIDKDGTINYSVIKILMRDVEGLVLHSLAPTMVRDMAKAKITVASKTNVQIVITDINGRIMQTQNVNVNAGSQDILINATRLAQGMFQVTAYISGEKSGTLRFIKL